MLDVEARGSGELTAWVDERRPLVIGGAFVAAVLLGIVIGLLTAPHGTPTAPVEAESPPPAAELMPPQAPVSWDGTRRAGTAHNMKLQLEPNPAAVRLALSWTVAEKMRGETDAATPTPADVTITEGRLFFGAVEGAAASSDVYWALGETDVAGVGSQPTDPHLWQRVGAGPWRLMASGAAACSEVPPALVNEWQTHCTVS